MLLIVSASAAISPLASTVSLRFRLPCATAVTTSAMPIGLRALMMSAILAAAMSTVSASSPARISAIPMAADSGIARPSNWKVDPALAPKETVVMKDRVAANSPSLWPTMFSVTYTGMNFFPLCTAIVRPTISGSTVERWVSSAPRVARRRANRPSSISKPF